MSDCDCNNDPEIKNRYAKTIFIIRLRSEPFDELKRMLKWYEANEKYEHCRCIQNEIDFRVSAGVLDSSV